MANKLTNKRDVPFELCFKYPLQRGFTFKELSQNDNRDLQRFLDKVSQMTVQQVDLLYARKPDKNDSYNGEQVFHYEVTDRFRIHVIIEEGYYKIVRLDPNHLVHN